MRRIVDFLYPSKRLHSSNFIQQQVVLKKQILRYFWFKIVCFIKLYNLFFQNNLLLGKVRAMESLRRV